MSDFNAQEEDLILGFTQKVNADIGAHITDKQKSLILNRVRKRIRDLKLQTAEEYIDYYNTNIGEEKPILVSLLTTHHTFFFREYAHFEFVKRQLPALIEQAKKQGRNKIRIWSAACSRGQEVYSLAMLLAAYVPKIDPSMDFEVWGSDVDEHSVKIGVNGVYRWNETKSIPSHLLTEHWVKGTGEIADFMKVKKHLRDKCKFFVNNLTNPVPAIAQEKFDIIFCRNVFIYFNVETITLATKNLMKHLYDHSPFIVGLSESIPYKELGLQYSGSSIYGVKPVIAPVTKPAPMATSSVPSAVASSVKPEPKMHTGPVRVICVDDSPTVLAMLKKMLSKEHGFEVVGVAKNGLEAIDLVKKTEYDVMTLDIHMPEMNGLEYLEKNFSSNHKPVIIVSSVSRDDAKVALKALDLGASDYIEKPSMESIAVYSDQIRFKLKDVLDLSSKERSEFVDISKKFGVTPMITNVGEKLKVIYASVNRMKEVVTMVSAFEAPQPACMIFLIDGEKFGTELKSQIEAKCKLKVVVPTDATIHENNIHIYDLKNIDQYSQVFNSKNLVTFTFLTNEAQNAMKVSLGHKNSIFLFDELLGDTLSKELPKLSNKIVMPWTSLGYESDKHLADKKAAA